MSTPSSPRKKTIRTQMPNLQTPVKLLSTPTRASSVSRNTGERKKGDCLKSPVYMTPRSATKKQFQKSTEINNIKVIARFRPENYSEKKGGYTLATKFLNTESVQLGNENFTFDRVFAPESSQADVFQFSVSQTVDDLFQGYNGTVLAYGQTGSGKSYTMMGSDIAHDLHKGLIPRITDMIFQKLKAQDSKTEYTLSASYFEIYLEQVRDLLVPPKEFVESNLQIHEDTVNGIHVRDLTKVYIGTTADIYRVIQKGTELRAKASTDMNLESSRSHALFQINLVQENPEFGIKRSKLFLIDLAGSEKVGKTRVSGQGLEEAKKINSSLSALGSVINALTDHKSSHVPYRDSKLTRILQESLGGNSRTNLIINCSPSSYNEAETLSTLRFGTRAKKIKNKAHINAEPSQLDLINQVEQLKKINENQNLYTKTLEHEIGVLKANNQKHTESITPEFDSFPKIEKVTENTEGDKTRREEVLEEELLRLRSMLSLAPNLIEGSVQSSDAQKLQESQSINRELMLDLEEKCLKLVSTQLELEETKGALHKEKSISDNTAKLFALETTLDQFSKQLEESQRQNDELRKELVTVRKISDTRQERIHTLESIVKNYESTTPSSYTNQPSSSSGGYLSMWSKSIKKYATSTTAPSLRSVYTTDTDDTGLFRTDLGLQMDHSDADLSLNSVDSMQDSYITKPPFTRVVPGSYMKRQSTSSHASSTASGLKMGLNLNIIKPLRGGNNIIPEQ